MHSMFFAQIYKFEPIISSPEQFASTIYDDYTFGVGVGCDSNETLQHDTARDLDRSTHSSSRRVRGQCGIACTHIARAAPCMRLRTKTTDTRRITPPDQYEIYDTRRLLVNDSLKERQRERTLKKISKKMDLRNTPLSPQNEREAPTSPFSAKFKVQRREACERRNCAACMSRRL